MSAAEIINELSKLSESERRAVFGKLLQLEDLPLSPADEALVEEPSRPGLDQFPARIQGHVANDAPVRAGFHVEHGDMLRQNGRNSIRQPPSRRAR